jgi:Flp pilus assembly protein TadG
MSGDEGQGTAELALVLPVVAVLMLAIGQIGLVARDQVLLWHAAREGARAAAVDPRTTAARRAATSSTPGLRATRLSVSLAGGTASGDTVTTTLTYRSATKVPLVGALVDDVTMTASVSMRVE